MATKIQQIIESQPFILSNLAKLAKQNQQKLEEEAAKLEALFSMV